MVRVFALLTTVLALVVSSHGSALASSFKSSVKPLPESMKAVLKQGGFWHKGCPVALADLRVVMATYHGFRGRKKTGQLIVNRRVAYRVRAVLRRVYALNFPIRHMGFSDFYGPVDGQPPSGDVTASFHCRQAVPSPCTGGSGTGSWSMHAYGLAIDVNPRENPYVGCGQSRDPATRPYFDRSKHRPGMVTPKVIAVFRSIGWGWGGSWTGNTKDYMHFSSTGH